jgi:hypothetical protein
VTATTTTTAPADATWDLLILSERNAAQTWEDIFSKLGSVALTTANPSLLHRETTTPDRLIAECAWNLWQSFPTDAPNVVSAIRDFWSSPSSSTGTAVLVLDALSLRELPLILAAGQKRGIRAVRHNVRGSVVPTDTNRFAAALGLPSRSRLSNNEYPQSFIFAGSDVHTDVLDSHFADCVARVAAKPRLFIWHEWPDHPLIHNHAEVTDGDAVVAAEIKRTISSDDFWAFINALRQGRRLLITGDHGYATACEFSSEIKDEESIRLFSGTFGAMRAIREDPTQPWPRRDLPPRVLRFPIGNDTWLVVIGQRKWKVRGGFPTLCHYGLSLLEAAVPVIEFPAA